MELQDSLYWSLAGTNSSLGKSFKTSSATH